MEFTHLLLVNNKKRTAHVRTSKKLQYSWKRYSDNGFEIALKGNEFYYLLDLLRKYKSGRINFPYPLELTHHNVVR